MGADYTFHVKSIATYAPAFLTHNNSVLAGVSHDLSIVKDIPSRGNKQQS